LLVRIGQSEVEPVSSFVLPSHDKNIWLEGRQKPSPR